MPNILRICLENLVIIIIAIRTHVILYLKKKKNVKTKF